MTTYRFSQVDVFGASALSGNPLAVVDNAEGLSDQDMLAFARWTGLSETTFLLPPTEEGADYRVRIFTPSQEYPFAGHPTLGSAHAWLQQHGEAVTSPRTIVQECGVGLVPITVEPSPTSAGDPAAIYSFAAPEFSRYEPIDPQLVARVAAGLGIAEQQILNSHWISNGPAWMGFHLDSVDTVLGINPDQSILNDLEVGIIGIGDQSTTGDLHVEVRALGKDFGEDPVTGSLNAGLAMWLGERGIVPRNYVAHQGRKVGADGRIHVSHDGQRYWIGGHCRTIISGSVEI